MDIEMEVTDTEDSKRREGERREKVGKLPVEYYVHYFVMGSLEAQTPALCKTPI